MVAAIKTMLKQAIATTANMSSNNPLMSIKVNFLQYDIYWRRYSVIFTYFSACLMVFRKSA